MSPKALQKCIVTILRKNCHFMFHVFGLLTSQLKRLPIEYLKIGDISVLVDLKDLCRRFGLEWNFVRRRSGKL